jgi:hypothetical protein
MNIRHRLIALGFASSLLGSTCALARPMPHFENSHPSYEKQTATSRRATDGARHLPSHANQDDWPADMILD